MTEHLDCLVQCLEYIADILNYKMLSEVFVNLCRNLVYHSALS